LVFLKGHQVPEEPTHETSSDQKVGGKSEFYPNKKGRRVPVRFKKSGGKTRMLGRLDTSATKRKVDSCRLERIESTHNGWRRREP